MTLSHDHYTLLMASRACQLSSDHQFYDNTYVSYLSYCALAQKQSLNTAKENILFYKCNK